MTTKEKQLKVLEAFGLKVGDTIEIIIGRHYKVAEDTTSFYLERTEDGDIIDVDDLIYKDWEKVEPSLKDKKCGDFRACKACPFESKKTLACYYFFGEE